jgi:hypothetical protein
MYVGASCVPNCGFVRAHVDVCVDVLGLRVRACACACSCACVFVPYASYVRVRFTRRDRENGVYVALPPARLLDRKHASPDHITQAARSLSVCSRSLHLCRALASENERLRTTLAAEEKEKQKRAEEEEARRRAEAARFAEQEAQLKRRMAELERSRQDAVHRLEAAAAAERAERGRLERERAQAAAAAEQARRDAEARVQTLKRELLRAQEETEVRRCGVRPVQCSAVRRSTFSPSLPSVFLRFIALRVLARALAFPLLSTLSFSQLIRSRPRRSRSVKNARSSFPSNSSSSSRRSSSRERRKRSSARGSGSARRVPRRSGLRSCSARSARRRSARSSPQRSRKVRCSRLANSTHTCASLACPSLFFLFFFFFLHNVSPLANPSSPPPSPLFSLHVAPAFRFVSFGFVCV